MSSLAAVGGALIGVVAALVAGQTGYPEWPAFVVGGAAVAVASHLALARIVRKAAGL